MTKAVDTSIAAWREAAESLAAGTADMDFVRALREEALGHFRELGLPHRKLEAWRHTSLAALERIEWAAPATASPHTPAPAAALAEYPADRVVLVDGRFDASASAPVPNGALVASIAAARSGGAGHESLGAVLGQVADAKRDGFTALNTALLDDGALIEIEGGADLAKPLHLLVLDTAPMRLTCPRLALVARAGSRATIVVEHATHGTGPRLGNFLGEIVVEANARLDVVVIEREGDESFLVSNLHSHQARDSRLAIHTITLGGRIVRNGLASELADTGAEIDMRGLFIGAGSRHIDNHTIADHAVPHCVSRELYKGILGGASHGVFCGRVIVRPDAQKTDSSQSNPNLLLTDRAEIDTQPQLEIYADDVKCSHGSTIGRLDEEALFYLRSRGIGPVEARGMLTRGFANEIVDGLPGNDLRARVAALVDSALDVATSDDEGVTK